MYKKMKEYVSDVYHTSPMFVSTIVGVILIALTLLMLRLYTGDNTGLMIFGNLVVIFIAISIPLLILNNISWLCKVTNTVNEYLLHTTDRHITLIKYMYNYTPRLLYSIITSILLLIGYITYLFMVGVNSHTLYLPLTFFKYLAYGLGIACILGFVHVLVDEILVVIGWLDKKKKGID